MWEGCHDQSEHPRTARQSYQHPQRVGKRQHPSVTSLRRRLVSNRPMCTQPSSAWKFTFCFPWHPCPFPRMLTAGISGFTYLCREKSCWHLVQSWNISGSKWGKFQSLYKQRSTNKPQLTWLTGVFDPVGWIVTTDWLIKTSREEKDTREENLVVVSESQMSNTVICRPWVQLAESAMLKSLRSSIQSAPWEWFLDYVNLFSHAWESFGKGLAGKTLPQTNLAQTPECQCLGSNTVCVTGIDKILSPFSVYHNHGCIILFIMLKIMWKTFGSTPQCLEIKLFILSDFPGWAE